MKTSAKVISNSTTSNTAAKDENIKPTEAKKQTHLTATEQKELSDELYRKILLSYQWNDFFFG